MYYNTKKLKPSLVAFYDTRPENGAVLFSKEKISKGADKQGKSEEKRISGEAYDIKTHTHPHTHLTALFPGLPG